MVKAIHVCSRSLNANSLFGYWLGYETGNRLADVPESVDVVMLGFAVTAANHSLNLDLLVGIYKETDLVAEIHELRARGTKVLLSIQGDPKTDSHWGWSNLDPATFSANVQRTVDRWHLDGVAFDIEPTYTPKPSENENIIHVIRNIRTSLGSGSILSRIRLPWIGTRPLFELRPRPVGCRVHGRLLERLRNSSCAAEFLQNHCHARSRGFRSRAAWSGGRITRHATCGNRTIVYLSRQTRRQRLALELPGFDRVVRPNSPVDGFITRF